MTALPAFPGEFAGTQAAAFHQGLTAVTTAAMIQSGCGFTEEGRTERMNLETTLAEADPAAAHAKAEAALTQAVAFDSEMEVWVGSFGEGFAQSLGEARTAAACARKAAQDYANTFFACVPLPGAGEETWRRMWMAADAYAEQRAYSDHAHPTSMTEPGACCVSRPWRPREAAPGFVRRLHQQPVGSRSPRCRKIPAE